MCFIHFSIVYEANGGIHTTSMTLFVIPWLSLIIINFETVLNVAFKYHHLKKISDKFHGNIKSKLYVRPKSNALCFGVHHFAGRVVYQAEGFLDKNRHFLAPEVIQLLRASQLDTVRYLFQCPITKTGNLYSASPAPNPSLTKVNLK